MTPTPMPTPGGGALGGEPDVPSVSEVASAYIDGEVGVEQAAWVAANEGVDAALSADLASFGRVKDVLGGLPRVEADAATWAAIDSGVRAGVAAQRRRGRVVRVAGVAAAVVLASVFAFGAARMGGTPTDVAARGPAPAPTRPATTRGALPRPLAQTGTGAVAAARGIGSVVERAGVAPRSGRTGTSSTTTSTRPVVTVIPPR